MGSTKRCAMVIVFMVAGLAPAANVNAELSHADAERYLTAVGDVGRLKGEATRAYQDAQTKFNAKDVAGACGDLRTSADKFDQMAQAEGVIISLSPADSGSASLHRDGQSSELKARQMVLATMAKVCTGSPAAESTEANSDAIHAKYDADMTDYEALNKAGKEHLILAQNATDTTVKCREYKADIEAMQAGRVKMDEMITLLREAKADPSEMETTNVNNQATMEQVQAIYDKSCAGT